MSKIANPDPIFKLKHPWLQHSHNVWMGSTLHVSRNLSKFHFPHLLDKTRSEQVVSLLFEGLKNAPNIQNPLLFHSEDIGPLEKDFLYEHFLVQNGFHQAHKGEGFVIDSQGDFLAVLNLQNHLQLFVLDTQQEIEKSWNRLNQIEGFLSKTIDIAYNPRFGFLTSDPKKCGTALQVTLFLHIPAIIHMGELPEILEKENEEEVYAAGLLGSATEMIGDILVAQNTCTLGLTEEYILTTMRMWATRAVIAEISLRKKLMSNNHEHMKNKISRAFGLLTHSYQLETVEALNGLSLIKLGVDIGWIIPNQPVNMNEVLLNCRRAHLLNIVGKDVPIPDLPRKRAEYLHGIVSNLRIVI